MTRRRMESQVRPAHDFVMSGKPFELSVASIDLNRDCSLSMTAGDETLRSFFFCERFHFFRVH